MYIYIPWMVAVNVRVDGLASMLGDMMLITKALYGLVVCTSCHVCEEMKAKSFFFYAEEPCKGNDFDLRTHRLTS